jgi:hypothetical protein
MLSVIGSVVISSLLANQGPCANLGSPPTVNSCWSCFQSLLSDCDRNNPEGVRRKSCYDASNTFFVWCLNRVAPVNPNPRTPKKVTYNPLTIGQDYFYSIEFDERIVADSVNVFIRNNGVQEAIVPFVIFDGNVLVVSFDTNDIKNSIGIVTTISNNGVIEFAHAISVGVDTDLNSDGIVDTGDIVEAINQYVNGLISYDKLISVIQSAN